MTFQLRRRGFTLVEVLVALVIVAAASAAVLGALSNAANSAVYLRDHTFAQWIALNRLTEVRTALVQPTPGTTSGDVGYGGEKWKWQQQVVRLEAPGLRRVDIEVSRDGDPQVLATAVGVLGSALAPSTGGNPEWEPAPAGPPQNPPTQPASPATPN